MRGYSHFQIPVLNPMIHKDKVVRSIHMGTYGTAVVNLADYIYARASNKALHNILYRLEHPINGCAVVPCDVR